MTKNHDPPNHALSAAGSCNDLAIMEPALLILVDRQHAKRPSQ